MKRALSLTSIVLCFGLLLFSCGKDDGGDTSGQDDPKISSFSPTSGPVGTEIFIMGQNFGSTAAANTVKIGNTAATIATASTTELFIIVPEGATTGKISVTANGKTDTGGTFTVTDDKPGVLVLNKNQLELFTLDSETLSLVSGNDENATISWSSDDENVAVVDDNGKVTGIMEGSATITATVGDNDVDAVVHVKASIFAIGYETIEDVKVAKIWKNGIPTNLTDGTRLGVATSVFVYSTDVYVSGIESNQNDLPSAKVWKNGEPLYTLSDANNYGVAHSIYVYDGDVYVAGSETNENEIATAIIWKDGVTYATLTGGTEGSLASGIFVNEVGIYTAGHEESQEHVNGTAKLWKNTAKEDLTEETYHSRAHAVYANGSNSYVAGYEENESGIQIAKVWKNGEVTNLTDGSKDAEANSIFVVGEDIYVAGGYFDDMETSNQAIVWKNDAPTTLGTAGSAASSVYLYGGDVYVGGYQSDGDVTNATVWKNQVSMNLTLSDGAGDSAVLSIFIR